MRGALLIMMLLSLFIVGILLVKNLSSPVDEDLQKSEAVQKARQTKQKMDAQTRKMTDRLKETGPNR